MNQENHFKTEPALNDNFNLNLGSNAISGALMAALSASMTLDNEDKDHVGEIRPRKQPLNQ